MLENRRSYLALVLAALLPIVLFASAIALIVGFREQAALEASALSKVREIASGIDRYIAAQLKAAEIISKVGSLQRGDLEQFYDFAARLKADEPGWNNIVVSDRAGQQLINLARPFGAPLAGLSDPGSFRQAIETRAPVIGDLADRGIVSGEFFVPMRVPVFEGDAIKYIVSIALDPRQLSKLFSLADAPGDWVGAIVDRNGRLLARSVLADQLVGRQATPAALEAIKHGKQGIYEGRTLEGLDTVFVFYTSPLTGWSVHYAVPRAAYNAPLHNILWIVVLCTAAAVAVALFLFSIVSREAARQRAEQARREIEAQFRTFAQAMPNHVWTSPPDGLLDWFNDQTYAYSGAKPGELDGEGWTRIVHPDDIAAAGETWAASVSSGKPYEHEFRLRGADGIYRWHVARALPIHGKSGEITRWIGTNTDIEDQKNTAEALAHLNDTLEQQVEERSAELLRTQDALRQSQKMESLGNLTGGIAHDFNNMLTGIGGSIDFIRRRLAAGRTDGLDRYIDAASKSTQRAAALTHRLLAFARQQSLDIKAQDINALVGGLEEVLRRTLGEKVALATELQRDLWPGLTDANQLESALLNLAINARDAMPDGGQLTIETANRTLDGTSALLSEGVAPGDYVVVSVSDTGVGMSPDVIAKAFDPFFTTKPIGQGTGLGLSMIYGFMKQSEGHVRIYSEVGRGTTVRLYLRRAPNAAERAVAKLSTAAPRGRGETVLLVEDDATVRLLMTDMLTELGYHYIQASEAQAAIPYLQSDQRIDLLITDVGMPNINGRQLAEIARQNRPGLKVLFITGYAEHASVRASVLPPGMAIVTKPFSFEAMAQKIREMMSPDGPPTNGGTINAGDAPPVQQT